MTYKTILPGILAISLIPVTANAESQRGVDHQGFYAGAGYGYVKSKGADDFEDDNDAGRVFIGGQFSQVFSVEGSYIDFGKYGGNVASADIDGYTLALKAGIPLGEHVTLYGQGGQLWWNADLKALGASGDTDGEELFYGAGVAFALTRNLDLRLEYTRFNVEFEEDEIGIFAESDDLDTDLDYVSAAVQYNF